MIHVTHWSLPIPLVSSDPSGLFDYERDSCSLVSVLWLISIQDSLRTSWSIFFELSFLELLSWTSSVSYLLLPDGLVINIFSLVPRDLMCNGVPREKKRANDPCFAYLSFSCFYRERSGVCLTIHQIYYRAHSLDQETKWHIFSLQNLRNLIILPVVSFLRNLFTILGRFAWS